MWDAYMQTHARTHASAHTRRLSHCFWRPLCGWEQAAPALPSRLRRAVWPFTLAQQSRPVSVRTLRGQLLPRTLASSAGPIMNIPPAMKVILSDTQLSGHIVSAALFAAFEGRPSQRPHRPCPLLLDLVTKSDCKMTQIQHIGYFFRSAFLFFVVWTIEVQTALAEHLHHCQKQWSWDFKSVANTLLLLLCTGNSQSEDICLHFNECIYLRHLSWHISWHKSSDMCEDAIKCNIGIAILGFSGKKKTHFWHLKQDDRPLSASFLLETESDCRSLLQRSQWKMLAGDLAVEHF